MLLHRLCSDPVLRASLVVTLFSCLGCVSSDRGCAGRNPGVGAVCVLSHWFPFVCTWALSPSPDPSGCLFHIGRGGLEVYGRLYSGNQCFPAGVSEAGVTGVLRSHPVCPGRGGGPCAASRSLGRCHFYVCPVMKKMGGIILQLVGQRPYGELGVCGFVVEFGVSGDET